MELRSHSLHEEWFGKKKMNQTISESKAPAPSLDSCFDLNREISSIRL